ncbi:MAG TPA: ABC transporter substrate-binding protein [Stellaceae bacterium]|nr:ABC transporter substrate-binding protein [Stellaceae bacterium]
MDVTDSEQFPLITEALRHVSRRDLLDYFAAGGLAALASALPERARAADPDADEIVRIGYLPITDATSLLVAHANGYFEDEGLKVAKPTLIRGWAEIAEAFVARRFNIVHLLNPVPVWMRYNNKIPAKIMVWGHTNGSGIVVGHETEIKSFADLGGKQIAVPFWYSNHNIMLQMALRKAGVKAVIKPQTAKLAKDECNLQVMAPPEMTAGLAARKIDGYIVAEPFNALGELKANARMLRFTGDIWKNHPCCVITMHEDNVKRRPEWTQKIVNAIVRAELYASQHRKEVAQMLSADGKAYLPVPGAVVDRAMNYYDVGFYGPTGALEHEAQWHNHRIDFQPWPYPSATELVVKAMNQTVVAGDTTFLKSLDPAFVAKDLVEYTHVRAALSKYPDWAKTVGVDPAHPYERQEIVEV